MTTKPDPVLDDGEYVLVCSTGLHGRQFFRRSGLVFEVGDWRPVRIGDEDDLRADVPVLSRESFARVEAETEGALTDKSVHRERGGQLSELGEPIDSKGRPARERPVLAMKKTTPDEVRALLAGEIKPRDRLEVAEAKAAALEEKNAELEARLMRLEFALAGDVAKPAKERP